MKSKQIENRLNALILKDKQMINGYRLAIVNTKSKTKAYSYNARIGLLEKSIVRKLKAINYIKQSSNDNYVWTHFCSMFGFRAYKQ